MFSNIYALAYQTTAAPDPTLSAPHKGFITKLNTTGTGLIFSTFLTGDAGSAVASIVLDTTGNIYVTGSTSSTNFPVTSGAFRTASSGSEDAFVAKLNPSASSLIYSTYLGGSSYDASSDIAIDSSGNAYVIGITGSANFPITTGAFQTVFASPGTSLLFDGYITKLNSTGTGLIYSTVLRR
ncbi:MAG TPA: SBBP repeat-containing protein [Pyrinomonadaceae bacterium]